MEITNHAYRIVRAGAQLEAAMALLKDARVMLRDAREYEFADALADPALQMAKIHTRLFNQMAFVSEKTEQVPR